MEKGNHDEKYGLPKEDHRTSRRNGRSHLVVRLPALRLLPFGRLRVVGVVWSWRRPQQKEEAG